MKELEMYKQRAFIQLICTLFFSLTLVCVIEIYLVSFGVFSYLLIAIILVWQFSAARQRIQSMKNELDEERLREENERYNQQVYGQFLEKMSQSSREIPDIQYMGNLQSHYVNNDERMKLLQSWANNLLIKHQVHFVSLSSLVSPYIHLIEKIQKLDDSFQQKANIHPLQDLQIDEKLTENLKILHQYRALLMEKGNQLVHDYNATRLGLEGEKRVNEELALYDDVLMNIPNVRFEVNGSSVETDNLVLSPFGIFAIEVKNIGSSGKFKIKIEKDGRWVKVFKNSSQVTTNVTTQVYRHVALKQKLINHELRKLNYPDYIEIKPLIVFANEKVDIMNESNVPVVRTSNIYHHISQFPKELDKDVLKMIEQIVKAHTLPPKGYEIEDIHTYINRLTDYLNPKLTLYQNLYEKLEELEKNLA